MKKEDIWTPIIEGQIYKYLADENGDVDHKVKTLMDYSLGRVLHKTLTAQFPEGGNVFDVYNACESSRLLHISDWLIASHANNEAWLRNVDDKGRPKKLMKFSTVEQIMVEADKAMMKAAQQCRDIVLDASQERIIAQLEDGFTMVELLSPKALDRESSYMQHCIGNGGYDHKVGTVHFGYLSLRDPANKPHATIELMADEMGKWHIMQLQGKQNKFPLQRYVELIVPFIRERDYGMDARLKSNLPFIIDVDGQWHHIGNLPSQLKCHTFNPMTNTMADIKMPDHMSVFSRAEICFKKLDGFPKLISFGDRNTKNVGLEMTHVEIDNMHGETHIKNSAHFNTVRFLTAPESITVDGNCVLAFMENSKMPKAVAAMGTLVISGQVGEEFDTKLEAGGDITFWKCKKLKTITHGIVTKGRLSIFGSEIRDLPDGIDVRELLLTETNVTTLPEGTKVSEKLILDNQVFWEHIPDSIDDDVIIAWKDSHRGPTLEDESGPATVGEWRSQQLRLGM